MKYTFLLLIACIGFAYSVFLDSNAFASLLSMHSRTRTVRDIGASRLEDIEAKVRTLCGNSTQFELKNDLQSTRYCIRDKQIYVTPRDEYIQHIDTCSLGVRRELKKCLKGTEYSYFPDFCFKLFESVVKFLYDDLDVIATGLSPCMSRLETPESDNDYETCVIRHRHSTDENSFETKAIFCKKLISINKCFIKQLNDTCTDSKDLTKFKKDYMLAIERPCE